MTINKQPLKIASKRIDPSFKEYIVAKIGYMEKETEKEGIEHLKHIEVELEEIKKRTPNSWRAFVNGLFQGAGAIVGSIVAIIGIGWLLSFFDIIPGLGEIAAYVQNALNQLPSRYK